MWQVERCGRMLGTSGVLGTKRAVYGPPDRVAYGREKLPCALTTSALVSESGRAPRDLFQKARSGSFSMHTDQQMISTKCGLMATPTVGSCTHVIWSVSLVCPRPIAKTHQEARHSLMI